MKANEFEVEVVQKQNIYAAKKIINCENYISTFCANKINVYELDNDFNLFGISDFSTGNIVLDIDFNHIYKDILLTSEVGDHTKIYKILRNSPSELICTLKSSNIKNNNYAKFNPIYENLVVSYSYKSIDFWDVNKYVNIDSIEPKDAITDLKWDISGNYIGYIENFELLNIIHRESGQPIKIGIKGLSCFEFKNNYEILTFQGDKSVKIYDIRKCDKPIFEKSNISFSGEIYDKNNDYIYMNDNSFEIYNTSDLTNIYKKDNISLKNPILLDSYFLENNEISNLLDQDKYGTVNIIKIKKPKSKPRSPNEAKKNVIKNSDKFVNDVVYMISNLSSFSSLIEQKNDIIFRSKKYFNFPDIMTELDKKKSELLPDRKEYVKDILDKTESKSILFKSVYEEYIYYLKLLIRDNTNKNLLKKYLQFLKKNETEISSKTANYEKYEDEVEYYKICFDKKEYKQYFGLIKEKSEKENLIEFMENFINIKDKNDFFCLVQNLSQISEYPYFNQPINDENEELIYYKNKLIIYFALKNTAKNSDGYKKNFPSLKKIFERVLNDNYLDDNNIIKNTHKFNLLISLIILPENEDNNITYILNLLSSQKCNEKEIQEIKNLFNTPYSSSLIKNISDIDKYIDKLCKNNVVEYFINKNKMISIMEDLYNYECLLSEKIKEMDLDKIKKFLKVILKMDIFKKIYSLLYENEDLNIICEDAFIDDYVDNHLFLVPYKSDKYCGVTDRFSCNSYIFFSDKISDKAIINNDIINTLQSSRFITIAFHEFNHYIYSYILHFNNYKDMSFNSPRKKEVILNEGGYLMELILFGDIVRNIKFEQALYILNEKNYSKSLKQFQKEYVNISSNINLSIQSGIYNTINYITSYPDFDDLRNVFIKAKMTNIEDADRTKRRNNCVLGRNLEFYYSD